jgi:hypothetical protein
MRATQNATRSPTRATRSPTRSPTGLPTPLAVTNLLYATLLNNKTTASTARVLLDTALAHTKAVDPTSLIPTKTYCSLPILTDPSDKSVHLFDGAVFRYGNVICRCPVGPVRTLQHCSVLDDQVGHVLSPPPLGLWR